MDTNLVNQTLAQVQKDVTSANSMGVAGNTGLSRQDLESALIKLTNRNTPLRDRIKRIKGNGLAHAWNKRTGLGLGGTTPNVAFYQENALPSVTTPAYSQVSASFKRIGLEYVVSNFAIAAGRSLMDLESEVVDSTLRSVVQAEEWAYFNGDSTVTNVNGDSSFDGLQKQITTNVVSLGGALTGTDPLDNAIELIRLQGGGLGNLAIFCSFGIERKINQIQQTSGNFRYTVNGDFGNVPFGVKASTYYSAVGPIPIVGDFFVNPATPYPYNNTSSSAAKGAATSNIYVVDLDYLEMVDLQPLGKMELARISDNVRGVINEYTVLTVKAEPWQAVITGVTEP